MAKHIEPKQPEQSVGSFFGALSAQYDTTITTSIPPYWEIMETLLEYTFLPRDQKLQVLELGCGTGNLSNLVTEYFPQAHLTLVDLSAEMLAQAAQKVEAKAVSLKLLNQGFMEVEFPENSLDLVVSSIALHHLPDEEKPLLYQRIFHWLKPGGKLRVADEILSLPADTAERFSMQKWETWARQMGATSEEIAMWQEHAVQHDHYASLHQQFQWLAEADFAEVDCYWRKVIWAVFGGEKPA